MKWSLSQLQKYRNKDFILDEMINVDELKKVDSSIREASPIHVGGRADISATKITFHLHLTGHFILPCSRTLVDVKLPIDVETMETFLLQSTELDYEDDVHIVKGDVVDLTPVIHELLLLEIPMQVFSPVTDHEDAAPQSGKGWEVIHEQEKVEKIDPRLAGLAKLLEQNDSSSKD